MAASKVRQERRYCRRPVYTEPRFKIIADAMGVVLLRQRPQSGCWLSAGRLVAAFFRLTEHTAQALIGGPALVERALGVKMTKEELGGASVHLRSGIVDNLAADEHDALAQIRRYLSYLPSSICSAHRAIRQTIRLIVRNRHCCLLCLATAIPASTWRGVLNMIFDANSVFEIGALYGPSQICALATLSGQPVGVLANDCLHYAGAMTAEAAQKYRRFVEMCDTFHLPIVNLIDQPGFMIGPESEAAGTIRYGMAAVAAAAIDGALGCHRSTQGLRCSHCGALCPWCLHIGLAFRRIRPAAG